MRTSLPPGCERRYIYVNDGSDDETPAVLNELASKDSRISVIHLSRNFGHQAALSAGVDAASGDTVITLDGDGQHPPSLIPEMLRLQSAGYDIVQAQRIDDTESSPFFKRSTSRLFYALAKFYRRSESGSGNVRLPAVVATRSRSSEAPPRIPSVLQGHGRVD